MSKKLPLKTALIITTYNQPDILDFVLETAFRQKVAPNEIIVADDGSGEETERVIRKAAEKSPVPIKHVWQPDEGFRLNHSRNNAIAVAESEYLILTDGDCFLGEWFVHDHLQFARQGRFIAGTRVNVKRKLREKILLTRNAKIKFLTRGTSKKFNSIRSYALATLQSRYTSPKPGKKLEPLVWKPGVAGANLAFFRTDAEHINGFNEFMSFYGGNDLEFCARLERIGVRRFKVRHYAMNYHFQHDLRHGVKSQKEKPTPTSLEYLASLDESQTRCVNTFGLTRALSQKKRPSVVDESYQKYEF
ncbi:MAG: glycosyltransferase [Thermoguttaceae bacterium]|nr:glycosyltransferase [Thermoguttaceae bacterium]MBR5758031.1 glycosyltransferase [Thermoguttaceae bacterium]